MAKKIVLLGGSANMPLANAISKKLKVPLTPVECKRFNDGELYVHIGKSVRGSCVFIVQPTSPPVNDKLMEMLLIIDACKRASAAEINVIIPYYGYARQDRKNFPREPISAKVVANMIETAGADRVVTFDLHVDQIQGFFDIPVDNLEVVSILADYLSKDKKNLVIASPDVGGARRARKLGKILHCDIAVIDKRRPRHGESQILNVIGDVDGKDVVIVDDMIDSGGSACNAAKALSDKGAKSVCIAATHALFSKDAVTKLQDPVIKEVIVADTIEIPEEKKFKTLTIIPLADVLARSIKMIADGVPMGPLFDELYRKVEAKFK